MPKKPKPTTKGKLDLSKGNLYTRGAARFSDLIYLSLKDRKLDKRSVRHSRLIGLYKGDVGTLKDVTWPTVGMCVVKKPAEKLIVVSDQGDVFTYVAGQGTTEQISPAPFDLRFAGTIDGLAYACGMKRQVYRRDGERKWTAMHAPEGTGKTVVGFEAIAGFNSKDIYAVGWGGELWHLAKGRWRQRPSPVNVILTGVCCAPDGFVYVCGQGGVLLRGREDSWEVLEQDDLEDDFWDIHFFDDTLYVASMSFLYALDGARLVPVNFGSDSPDSCYKLTSAGDVLWSIGQENLFAFDGTAWTRWD